MRYTTLADAIAGTNAVSGSPFALPARDLTLDLVDGNAPWATPTWANTAIFMSHWYANAGSSPSNSNYGFIQMYDIEGGSVMSLAMVWDATMTAYSLSLIGGNGLPGCVSPGDCGRL